MKIPNIAVQLPRGYKLNFSKIICPKYDKPPKSINREIKFSFKKFIRSFRELSGN